MSNTQMGLIGRKLGMTQLFDNEGVVTPVTVVEAGPNRVLQVKSDTTKDGYNGVQLGFGVQKATRLGKAALGHMARSGEVPVRYIIEFRVAADVAAAYSAGQALNVSDLFAEGGTVDVTGTSKGKGFAGVMKRHNFAGFERSHGVHEYFRHGGSIGTRLTPGMTLKGKKMGGHMGSARVTIQNLRVVKIDTERNLIFIKGAVPGPVGGIVRVRTAVKGSA